MKIPLVFVDDYSLFSVVFGLKANTEVAYHIKVLRERVASRFNTKYTQRNLESLQKRVAMSVPTL